MNIQELKDGLFEFGKEFGFSKYDDLNIADLADLLVRLDEVGRTALRRIEVLLDEKGERTTEVFVEPGVTVKEVGLGDLALGVPTEETKPCPDCKGTGRADGVPSVSCKGNPCPTCDGLGFVPA